ncbi:MAG: hypothetical protein R6U68_06780 [Desulfobacteraceae bacterium]
MPEYFICQCCGRRTPRDPRVKIRQKYCGQKLCQQSRKNRWEKDRLKKDPSYRQRRNLQKSEWRKKHPAHQYQQDYRKEHPDYVEINREKQQIRNKNAQKAAPGVMGSNIVKTDALTVESPIRGGLYEILPCKTRPGENIVKTDALIVELRVHRGSQKVLVHDSG